MDNDKEIFSWIDGQAETMIQLVEKWSAMRLLLPIILKA